MLTEIDGATDIARLAELERECAKLRKINKVLIDQVERSMDYHGNAYSMFQTAITLESKVRDRTAQLVELTQSVQRG